MRCQDEAGKRAGLHDDRGDSAGRFGRIGWHTFQHTYRSWLDATGAPIGVQQKLMRHAHVATTMNVYGNALMESKREANSKIVQLVLGPRTPGCAIRGAISRGSLLQETLLRP